MTDLHDPIFTDETKAREYLEAVRWPEGPVCPHCGILEKASKVSGGREGLYFCNACRKQYTVTVGTVYERSKIALTKWLLATYLLSSSKKGMSAHQLHRMLGVTYKTAWFMAHRIREAMTDSNPGPMGGKGDIVEADETYLGSSGYEFVNDKGWQMKRGLGEKKKVLTLVERGGRARSIMAEDMNRKTVRDFLVTNADRNSVLMIDESNLYKGVGKEFKRHFTVNHAKGEYARGFTTTNTVEGYFSIFKRGMIGTYQHCGEQHLQRYLTEFDFRYSNRKISDKERAGKLDLVYGRTVALEMLLRGLYAKWAMEAPDPEASNKRMIDALLASMWEVDSPKSETQGRIWYWAENTLIDFQRNVEIRLKGNLSGG